MNLNKNLLLLRDCGADAASYSTEPIVMEGSVEFRILKDKWTAVSVDDKR